MFELAVDDLLNSDGFFVEVSQLTRAFEPGHAGALNAERKLFFHRLSYVFAKWNSFLRVAFLSKGPQGCHGGLDGNLSAIVFFLAARPRVIVVKTRPVSASLITRRLK